MINAKWNREKIENKVLQFASFFQGAIGKRLQEHPSTTYYTSKGKIADKLCDKTKKVKVKPKTQNGHVRAKEAY